MNISNELKTIKDPELHAGIGELIQSIDKLTYKDGFNFTDDLSNEMKNSLMIQINKLVKGQIAQFYPERSKNKFISEYYRFTKSNFFKKIADQKNISII
jgi:hypothetical protein